MRVRIFLIVAFVAVAAAGLVFTKPGRSLLAQLGLAKACSSSDCGE